MSRFPVPFLAVLTLWPCLASAARAQAQPVEVVWADRWNSIYHRFLDLDGEGSFNGPGEVGFQLDPAAPESAAPLSMEVREENGVAVTYWLLESTDKICRGVDLNQDGVLSGAAEVKVFRNSGVLDGNGWPRGLTLTDDGAVWWISGGLISQPHNGLSRLRDLNADGDAADAGEQVVMVNFNTGHTVEHDLGSAPITGWAMWTLAAAGEGVVAFTDIDFAHYLFRDLDHDGDVTGPDESILLLNASSERPDLPTNPDFLDGTLRALDSTAGYPAPMIYLATALEGGQRAYYFGTSASPFNPVGTNLLGQGLNFLLFRGVDGNGDGDVNDAGEVKLHFNGSHTDGIQDLLIMRGLDVIDGGTLYAAGIKPYPVLAPGPNGNTWIHRLEDLNGDKDAMDAGEQQFAIFDLQVHGYSPTFPIPPNFGNVMADPWDFSVRRLSPVTDMGGGTVGSAGAPRLDVAGSLAAGANTVISVEHAPPGAFMQSWISLSSTPLQVLGGTLYPVPQLSQILWVADGTGQLSVSLNWPSGFPSGLDLFMQFVVKDAGQTPSLLLTNGLKLTTP